MLVVVLEVLINNIKKAWPLIISIFEVHCLKSFILKKKISNN